MYLRLVFIHLWLILSARAGLRSHVFGCGVRVDEGVWRAVNAWLWGPAGATSQVLLVMRGRRSRFCWSGWGDDVGDRVGAVRWGCVVGTLGRRRHLGGRADVVVSQGEGTGAS